MVPPPETTVLSVWQKALARLVKDRKAVEQMDSVSWVQKMEKFETNRVQWQD